MCDHCFNAFDFTLPSGTRICGQCFEEMYCRSCWQHTNVVGTRIVHHDMLMCATCVNNTPQPPIQFGDFDDIYDEPPIYDIYNITPINDINNINDDINNDYDGTFAAPLLDEYMTQDNYEEDEPWLVAPIEDEIQILAQPAGFDMNAASLIEHLPDYMDNLINAQIEYDGNWFFVLDNQIYSVPYEIEVDDDHVRQDIRDHWDGVQWAGTIYGEYVAWR